MPPSRTGTAVKAIALPTRWLRVPLANSYAATGCTINSTVMATALSSVIATKFWNCMLTMARKP